MALVQYSDSESEAEQEAPPRKINKLDQDISRRTAPSTLPPLPAAFHDLYASSIRVSVRDDPSLHGGRKRVIPHIEGNWPTHIYLEWYPSKDELEILREIIVEAENTSHTEESKIHSLLHSDLGAQLPLHLSLSRPVVLQTEQRKPFLDMFRETLQTSDISPFEIQIQSVDWVCNTEKTRWFYVLRAKRPKHDYLNRLLRISNRSLALFGQPLLYEPTLDASEQNGAQRHTHSGPETAKDYTDYFHVSVAWTLEEPSARDRDRMEHGGLQRLNDLTINFDSLKAKIGNHVSSIPLARPSLH
ncbi:U6 snRNA phosphodiesterase Usb1 [Aspergillus pseudoustus]|uniref:U6 snRNA phosphodiesterase n=1 Tax=Aspergillus pseudoustus TaxID=1810923 RepID=A0ABR4KPM4_9EURO